MRSKVPARPAHGQDAAAAGRVGDQLVAGKGMGLPGGRGSPIELVIILASVNWVTGWLVGDEAGHRSSCYQPPAVHCLPGRDDRAPCASCAWLACGCRWVMRCPAKLAQPGMLFGM
jgi:hypothetical protein